MALTPEEIDELSQILDARAGHGRSNRPLLRLITPPHPKLLDHIAREAHLKRIEHLRRRYRLDWLVDQETFTVASVYYLEDCDLIRLLTYMERARECIVDGISFDDADLVRSVRVGTAPKTWLPDVNGERAAEQAAIGVGAIKSTAIGPADDDSPF